MCIDLFGHFKTGHHRLFLRPNGYDHRIRRIMHVERSAIDFLKGKPMQKSNRGEHISGGFDRNTVAKAEACVRLRFAARLEVSA